MNEALLDLRVKRFFCPHCGKWHTNNAIGNSGKLHSYDGHDLSFTCATIYKHYDAWPCGVAYYFKEGKCYYKTFCPYCDLGNLYISGSIPIKKITEENKKITFSVPFTTAHEVGRIQCRGCSIINTCLMRELGDQKDHRYMDIMFGLELE